MGQVIKPLYHKVRAGESWLVPNLWLLKGIAGYVGRDEYLDEPRILWEREFSEPLPLHNSEEEYTENHTTFGFVLNGKRHLFNKSNGEYLGQVYQV